MQYGIGGCGPSAWHLPAMPYAHPHSYWRLGPIVLVAQRFEILNNVGTLSGIIFYNQNAYPGRLLVCIALNWYHCFAPGYLLPASGGSRRSAHDPAEGSKRRVPSMPSTSFFAISKPIPPSLLSRARGRSVGAPPAGCLARRSQPATPSAQCRKAVAVTISAPCRPSPRWRYGASDVLPSRLAPGKPKRASACLPNHS